MMRKTGRKSRGSMIAEAVAAMALILPVLIVVMFVALEASYAYLLKSSLCEAAREAARDLAIAYGANPTVSTSRSQANTAAFDNIRINNVINNSAQFDDPVWNTAANPPTVSVQVRYLSGQYSLPVFPNPDPLNLSGTLQIAGNSTYRLQ